MPGDDASCLNLYQARRPTILGVPEEVLAEFDSSGRFAFANTRDTHMWPKLRRPAERGPHPVIGDMNTLMYSLHKGVGDVVRSTNQMPNSKWSACSAAASFRACCSCRKENFQRLFPQQVGLSARFWSRSTRQHRSALSRLLESDLDDYGFDAERVADRLAEFLSVQNTYLLTFQTLGGLGLLLGNVRPGERDAPQRAGTAGGAGVAARPSAFPVRRSRHSCCGRTHCSRLRTGAGQLSRPCWRWRRTCSASAPTSRGVRCWRCCWECSPWECSRHCGRSARRNALRWCRRSAGSDGCPGGKC